ncbi:lysylphosphatidylglycerol synthase transmembrane domain-containing protein [Leptothermofonsia sp. ETS-13]|uniref:lysylphosphatidylglycerol synthase transmembrane domain-containing protein n=1 Tax=Leptothermofonsia sp. ETS-13 TaxID=3035696 RepID=UPI003B9F3A6D
MKRSLSLLISLLILAAIYWKIDFQSLIQVFQNCDRPWMVISLGMVVPITMMTAWRLQQLMPERGMGDGQRGIGDRRQAAGKNSKLKTQNSELKTLSFPEANRLILVASTLNMVLPSKMGDIAKAYFMRERGHLSGSLALSLVVFEKACDMLSLLLWCAFGLLLYPQKDWFFWIMLVGVGVGFVGGGLVLGSRQFAQHFFLLGQKVAPKPIKAALLKLQTAWQEMHEYFWSDCPQLLKITLTSVFLWFLHLLQIWFFILALNAWTPFITNLALSPLAILAGLLPLTFAGVGTRDAALIFLYAPYFNAATAAALGVLCTSRYLIPAIAGLPFLNQFMATVRTLQK